MKLVIVKVFSLSCARITTLCRYGYISTYYLNGIKPAISIINFLKSDIRHTHGVMYVMKEVDWLSIHTYYISLHTSQISILNPSK